MKLYATVKSERASKGQGGEYLDIEIMNSDRKVVAIFSARCEQQTGRTYIHLAACSSIDITQTIKSDCDVILKKLVESIKGKKQKGLQ